jgi:hypothetical protein
MAERIDKLELDADMLASLIRKLCAERRRVRQYSASAP